MSKPSVLYPLILLLGWFVFSVFNNVATKGLLRKNVTEDDAAAETFNFPFTLCLISIAVQSVPSPFGRKAAPTPSATDGQPQKDAKTALSLFKILPYSAAIAGGFLLHRVALQFGPISVVMPTKVTTSILMTTTLSHVLSLERATAASIFSVVMVLAGTTITNLAKAKGDVEVLVPCIGAALVAGCCGSLKTVIGSFLLRSEGLSKAQLYSSSRLWATIIIAAPALYFELGPLLQRYTSFYGTEPTVAFPVVALTKAVVALYGMELTGTLFLSATSPVTFTLFNTLRAAVVSVAAMMLVETQPSFEQLMGLGLVFAAALTHSLFKQRKKRQTTAQQKNK